MNRKILVVSLLVVFLVGINLYRFFNKGSKGELIFDKQAFEKEEDRQQYINDNLNALKNPELSINDEENNREISGGCTSFYIENIDYLYKKFPIKIATMVHDKLEENIFERFPEEENLDYAAIKEINTSVPVAFELKLFFKDGDTKTFRVYNSFIAEKEQIEVFQYWNDIDNKEVLALKNITEFFDLINQKEKNGALTMLDPVYREYFKMTESKFDKLYDFGFDIRFFIKEKVVEENMALFDVCIYDENDFLEPVRKLKFAFEFEDNRVVKMADLDVLEILTLNKKESQDGISIEIVDKIRTLNDTYFYVSVKNNGKNNIEIDTIKAFLEDENYNCSIYESVFLDYEIRPGVSNKFLVKASYAPDVDRLVFWFKDMKFIETKM